MRAIIAGLGVIAFLSLGLFQAETVWARSKKSKEAAGVEAPVPKESKKKVDKAKEQALEAQRVFTEKVRQGLNNTEWEIELSLLSAKGKKESDVITFKENQIGVAGFVKKGFPPTNYTLTVQDGGIAVWETMQSSDKSGIAFWRGEIDADMQRMHGILSYHVDDKTTRDYSFSSISRKDISPGPSK